MVCMKTPYREATTVAIFVAREDQMLEYSDVGICLEGEIVRLGQRCLGICIAI